MQFAPQVQVLFSPYCVPEQAKTHVRLGKVSAQESIGQFATQIRESLAPNPVVQFSEHT